jgi:anti-anti-sigma factor
VTKSTEITLSRPALSERPDNSSVNSLVGWHGSSRSRPARRRRRSTLPSHSFVSFEASCIGEQAVLTVWGDLDLLTNAAFDAILDSVIDCGRGSVELDLRQLNFMHVSGLNAIAHGTQRLGDLGRSFTIRPPSATPLRTIESAVLAGLVRAEASEPTRNPRGSARPTFRASEPLIDQAAANIR